MNVYSEIEKIIEQDYSGYRGRFNEKFRLLHALLRSKITDEKFLEFLKDCRIKNPKPIYKIPDEVLKKIKK